MNREIKFRAWDNSDNVMYETIAFEDIITMEIIQFTGLLDKNGKEIYEGDILDDNKPWVVKQLEGGAWALDYANGSGERYLYPINKDLKIIGNIYQNPDLLESVQK